MTMIRSIVRRSLTNFTVKREFETLSNSLKVSQPIKSLPRSGKLLHPKICSAEHVFNQQQRRGLARGNTENSQKKEEDSSKQSQKNDEDEEESDEEDEDKPKLLMDFLPRGMPNIFYSLKNFYIVNFVIRTQIDKSFSFPEFVAGAKQAMVTVSGHLAHNQLDNLEGLVEKNALEEIRRNYEKLSVAERNELQIQPSDITINFAHHIDVETLHEGFTGTNKHIVKIFMVYDCIRDLENVLREKASLGTSTREVFEEFKQRKFVCNYEFTREYIEGKPKGDWMITKLLHIREHMLLGLMRP